MPAAANNGLRNSIQFTPQAHDDAFSFTEEQAKVPQLLDVMGNDQGGNAKSLFGVWLGNLPANGDLTAPGHTTAGAFSIVGDKISYSGGAYDYLQAGEHATVDITYVIRLGNGAFSVAHASITINGVNDIATITGSDAGAVTEDAVINTVSGDLNVVDLDHDQSSFNAQTNTGGTYGSLSIDSTGAWTYTLDNSNPLTDALNDGDVRHDIFTVTSLDGTQHTIDVTVNGNTDAPVLSDVELLFNWSFEDPDVGGVWAPVGSLAPWTSSGAGLEIVNAGYGGVGGDGQWLDTQGTPGGINLTQTLDIDDNSSFHLNLSIAAQQFDSYFTNPLEHLQVYWNGALVLDITQAMLGDYHNLHDIGVDVTSALSGDDTLQIVSVGANDLVGFALDSVSLKEWIV